MKTIEFKKGSKEYKYIARKIWQELFNIYKESNCNLTNLDSLLCDYYVIESLCKEHRTELKGFYFSFDCNKSWTSLFTGVKIPTDYKIQLTDGWDTINVLKPESK